MINLGSGLVVVLLTRRARMPGASRPRLHEAVWKISAVFGADLLAAARGRRGRTCITELGWAKGGPGMDALPMATTTWSGQDATIPERSSDGEGRSMTSKSTSQCVVVRGNERRDTYAGKQGLSYLGGISAESAGATGICMHLLTIPPGGRANAHLHEGHETAIYVLSGRAEMWHGDGLGEHLTVGAGDFLYIPAGVPHLPGNASDTEPCVAVLARTDPNEQESVILLPDLLPPPAS